MNPGRGITALLAADAVAPSWPSGNWPSMLWLGPVLVVAVGLVIVWVEVRERHRSRPPADVGPDESTTTPPRERGRSSFARERWRASA